MTDGSKYGARVKSNAKNTELVTIRLSYSTDDDILKKLDSVGNKSGYIKQLIRDDMQKNN